MKLSYQNYRKKAFNAFVKFNLLSRSDDVTAAQAPSANYSYFYSHFHSILQSTFEPQIATTESCWTARAFEALFSHFVHFTVESSSTQSVLALISHDFLFTRAISVTADRQTVKSTAEFIGIEVFFLSCARLTVQMIFPLSERIGFRVKTNSRLN